MPLLCVAFKTTAGLLSQCQHAVYSLLHLARSLPDEDASAHDLIEDEIAVASFSLGSSSDDGDITLWRNIPSPCFS